MSMKIGRMICLVLLLTMIELNESRFVWDFGSYCLNYCAKSQYKSVSVNVCSCQWISSNHRRMDRNILSSINNSPKIKLKNDFY